MTETRKIYNWHGPYGGNGKVNGNKGVQKARKQIRREEAEERAAKKAKESNNG